MSFGIHLPCIEFEAEAHVYGDDEPAPLELAALKFIHARNDAGEKPVLGDLVDFLSVGRWIAYQILIGFWTRGWVVIYPESGGVSLSDKVAARIATNQLEGMRPGVQPARVKFIYDLIAGQVAPHPGDWVLRDERRSDSFTYPKRRPAGDLPPERKGWERFDMPLDGYETVSTSELQAAFVMHPEYLANLRGPAIDKLELKILKRAHLLTPGMVRYYSVHFDVYRTAVGELRLEVNDDRPVQRALGAKLETAIIAALPDSPKLEASLGKAATTRDFVAPPVRRPLPSFVDLVEAVGDPKWAAAKGLDGRTLLGLARAWAAARVHVQEILARRVDLEASQALSSSEAVHEHLRARLGEAEQQVVLASPVASQAALERQPDRSRALTEVLAGLARSPANLFLATTMDNPPDLRVQFAQMENATTCVRIHARAGPHVSASFAIVDVDALLLSSEPILSDTDQAGLSLVFDTQSRRLRGGPLLDLMDRLARDLTLNTPGVPQLLRSRENEASPEMPEVLRDIVDAIDTLITGQTPELDETNGPEYPADFDDFTGPRAAVWLAELRRLSEDLENWVLRDSRAAEILIDGEIHDAAIALLERTAEEEPVVVGLSHVTDLRRNLQMRDAIAKRASTCSGTLYLCLPGDSHLDGAVEELTAEFARNGKVVLSRGAAGARWGFGFVLTASASVIASRGVGQKIQNIGRARRGTELGVQLFGNDLRQLALEIVQKWHPLAEAARHLQLSASWSRTAQPSVLKLYTAWFSTESPEDDGNRGLTLVEPILAAAPDMPWRPDDAALSAFPNACRHALLKSAARLAFRANRDDGVKSSFDEALPLLAARHWRDGEMLQAAVLADWNPDLPIGHAVLREMALSAALGIVYRGDPSSLFGQALNDREGEAFLSLAALLLLDGRAGALSSFINLLDDTPDMLRLDQGPLSKLVRGLARADADYPGRPFDPGAVPDLGDVPDSAGLWRDASVYVGQRRIAHSTSRSVVRLRHLMFKEPGTFMGDLSILFADEAPDLVDERRKVDRLRQVLKAHRMGSAQLRKEAAQDHFQALHDRLPGRSEVIARYQGKEAESVAKMFDFAAKILAAADYESGAAQEERCLLRSYRDTAAMLKEQAGNSCDPLSPVLLARLAAGRPVLDHVVPIHSLPTAGAAFSPPDWMRLQQAYFERELAPIRDGRTTLPIEPLPQLVESVGGGPAGAQASDRIAWKVIWELLEAVRSFGPDIADAHALGPADRRFRQLLSDRATEIAKAGQRLKLRQAVSEIASPDFERDMAALQRELRPLGTNLARGKDREVGAFAEALDRSERLLREADLHYTNALEQARAAIEEAPGRIPRRQIRQLLDLDLPDAARWLIDPATETEAGPALPETDPQFSVLFQACLQESRFRSISAATLAEKGVPEDSIGLFSTFLAILRPERMTQPSAEQVCQGLFHYFGAEPGEGDLAEELGSAWRIRTGNPTLLALAPFLVGRESDAPTIEILVAKERQAAEVQPGAGWRPSVFPPKAETAATGPEEPVRTVARSSHDLQALREMMRAAEAESRDVPALEAVPLVIQTFATTTIPSSPTLTYRHLIGFVGLSGEERRRAVTRAAMNLASSSDLSAWWQQEPAGKDAFRRWALGLIHARPYEALAAASMDEAGLFDIVRQSAEMLGIRIDSRGDGESLAYSNWCDLRCITYLSGGNLLNAHDLLFAGLRQEKGRRSIDLIAAVIAIDHQRSRFQARLLPPSLAPSDGQRSDDLGAFLESLALASIEDDEPGFSRDTFLALAAPALSHREVATLFDDMVAARLIAPLPGKAKDRYLARKLPWFFSISE